MIKISKDLKTEYIPKLKLAQRQEIGRAVRVVLQLQGLSGKEETKLFKEAMNSKVCDLEDTIEIKYI